MRLSVAVEELSVTVEEYKRQVEEYKRQKDEDMRRQEAEEKKRRDQLEQDKKRLIKQLAGFSAANISLRLPKQLRWRPFRKKLYSQLADSYLIISSSPLFDRDWYLDAHPDVRGSGIDPIFHYITRGWREGRAPGPLFDGDEYQRANADVVAGGSNPLVHYILYGQKNHDRCGCSRLIRNRVPKQKLTLPRPDDAAKLIFYTSNRQGID